MWVAHDLVFRPTPLGNRQEGINHYTDFSLGGSIVIVVQEVSVWGIVYDRKCNFSFFKLPIIKVECYFPSFKFPSLTFPSQRERERERERCKYGLNQDSRLLDILLSHWPLKNGMPK